MINVLHCVDCACEAQNMVTVAEATAITPWLSVRSLPGVWFAKFYTVGEELHVIVRSGVFITHAFTGYTLEHVHLATLLPKTQEMVMLEEDVQHCEAIAREMSTLRNN